MLLGLHVALALACVLLLARHFPMAPMARRDTFGIVAVSAGLAAALASGLFLLVQAGGLPNAKLFGHVMHWLAWLAVLTWAHAILRARRSGTACRTGVPLFLVLGASAAGVLAMVQDLI